MNFFESGSENRRTVRLTLTAKHTMPNIGKLSLFANNAKIDRHPLGADGHANPEDYPEEMNTALQDMLDRDAGFTESEIYDAGNEPEFEGDEEEGTFSLDEILDKLHEIGDALGIESNDPEDDDLLVFRTLGSMERKIEDDHEIIEIAYNEGDTMDETTTVIRFDPEKPGAVSIIHSGSVMSALVCEQGVRHISAYDTPIMPFQVAVYTKKCVGNFTFDMGGTLELDYLVEVRGADMQRTQMTIDAIAL